MCIINSYYKFSKLPNQKSKTRFDCVLSTADYMPFEAKRNKKNRLFVHYTDVPANFKATVKRKADKAIGNGTHISSVFVPDITELIAYGDVFTTSDAILIVFDADYTGFEIFVAKGKKNNQIGLYQLFADNDFQLMYEIDNLRKQAKYEIPIISCF